MKPTDSLMGGWRSAKVSGWQEGNRETQRKTENGIIEEILRHDKQAVACKVSGIGEF